MAVNKRGRQRKPFEENADFRLFGCAVLNLNMNLHMNLVALEDEWEYNLRPYFLSVNIDNSSLIPQVTIIEQSWTTIESSVR